MIRFPIQIDNDDAWAELAAFVLPPGLVSGGIQGALSAQRMHDLPRVTHFTPAQRRSFVDWLHRDEAFDEELIERHREKETGDDC